MMKKWIAYFVFFALTINPLATKPLEGVTKCVTTGGCGYEQCRSCPGIGPGVALSLALVGLMIAVAIQQSSEQHTNIHDL